MIVREWQARATAEGAAAYARFFAGSVLPTLQAIDGFEGAEVLAAGDEPVGIRVQTRWRDRQAILAFAGADPDRAVVEPEVTGLVIDFDDFVTHLNRLFPGETA